MKKSAYPTLLTIAASVGVVATAVSAARATPKALDILDHYQLGLKEDRPERKIDKVIAVAPVYIPSILFGAATIAAIVGANCLNIKTQKSMASAYMLLDNSFKTYRNKVDELYGEEADLKVREAISHDKHSLPAEEDEPVVLFHEPIYDVFFESTLMDVVLAEYHFNRNFILRGDNTMDELYSFLGIADKYPEHVITLGWSVDAGVMFYGYQWIDFNHKIKTFNNGTKYYEIEYPFEPTADAICASDWLD